MEEGLVSNIPAPAFTDELKCLSVSSNVTIYANNSMVASWFLVTCLIITFSAIRVGSVDVTAQTISGVIFHGLWNCTIAHTERPLYVLC